MIRQVTRRVLHGMLVAGVLAAWTAACAQSQAGDTVYRLHGTVVDGRTGQPLARALVVSGDRRVATMTNREGAFAVDVSVPSETEGEMREASIAIRAEKPGYVAPPRPVSLPLNATTSSTAFALKLMPAAAIEGIVSTPATDVSGNVQITLLRRRVQDGLPDWVPTGSSRANRRGEFRFGNLEPAEYTVMVVAYPPGGEFRRSLKEVTQRYPPVYFGDAPNISSAEKMTLHYGEIARAEIHLHLATYYPVTVAVGERMGNGLSVRVGGADRFNGFQFSYNARDGVAEGALPDGSYTLVLSSFGPSPGGARVPIQVSGAAVHSGPVALAPAGSIEVHVHPEFSGSTEPAPLFTQVFLRPVDDGVSFASGGSRPGQEQDFSIDNVQPGQYVVTAQPARGYVAALSSGETDLLQHPLTVNASGSAPAIDITLRDDSATLSVNVISGDLPVPAQCFVYVLPMSGGGRQMQLLAAADGKSELQNLAPGGYLLMASGDPSMQIPYRDPEAMRTYEGKGKTITLEAGQSLRTDVPLVDSGEGDQ